MNSKAKQLIRDLKHTQSNKYLISAEYATILKRKRISATGTRGQLDMSNRYNI